MEMRLFANSCVPETQNDKEVTEANRRKELGKRNSWGHGCVQIVAGRFRVRIAQLTFRIIGARQFFKKNEPALD